MESSIPFSLFWSAVIPQDTALVSIPNTACCAHHCFILRCCRCCCPRCFSHCCLYPSSAVTQQDMALVSIPDPQYRVLCPSSLYSSSLSTSLSTHVIVHILITWQVIIILVVVTFPPCQEGIVPRLASSPHRQIPNARLLPRRWLCCHCCCPRHLCHLCPCRFRFVIIENTPLLSARNASDHKVGC